MWKFVGHLQSNENLHLTRHISLEEKIKFAMAHLPRSYYSPAMSHLRKKEAEYFLERGCVVADSAQRPEPGASTMAPLSEDVWVLSEQPGLDGSEEGYHGPLPLPGAPPYSFYREALITFVVGPHAAFGCLKSLENLSQGSDTAEQFVARFEEHLQQYKLLNGGQALDGKIATRLLFSAMDSAITRTISSMDDSTYETARESLLRAAKAHDFRMLAAKSKPAQVESNNYVSPHGQHGWHTVSPHAQRTRHASSFGGPNDSIARILDVPTNEQYIERLCSLCGFTPNWPGVAQATSRDYSLLRHDVDSTLRQGGPYQHTVCAIRNLLPSKFTQSTTSTRESALVYEGLDQLSKDQLEESYRKRMFVENLKGARTFDDHDILNGPEEKQEPANKKLRRSARVESINVVEQDPSYTAFLDTCFAFTEKIGAEQGRVNTCFNCSKPGHPYRECPDLQNPDGTFRPFCAYCRKEHNIRQCPTLAEVQCKHCNNKGHTARYCPKNGRKTVRWHGSASR